MRRGNRDALDLRLCALDNSKVPSGYDPVARASKVENGDDARFELGRHIDPENGSDPASQDSGANERMSPGQERAQVWRGVAAEEGLRLRKEREETEEKRPSEKMSPARHEQDRAFDERCAEDHGDETFWMLSSGHKRQGA